MFLDSEPGGNGLWIGGESVSEGDVIQNEPAIVELFDATAVKIGCS